MRQRIGILGGSGQIGKSLAPLLAESSDVFLYSRKPIFGLAGSIQHKPLEEFGKIPLDMVVNAIGSGDPKKIHAQGKEIIEITRYYDQCVLGQLGKSVNSYIFLSSVAVYGNSCAFPVEPKSVFFSDNILRSDYGCAKFEAECRHQEHGGPIIDLRIFGFVSACLPLDSSFLIAQMYRSIQKQCLFEPIGLDFYRDYISPEDLADFLLRTASALVVNQKIDAISSRPTSRNEILAALQKKYSLEIAWASPEDACFSPPLSSASACSFFNQNKKKSSLENVTQVAGLFFGK